MMKNARPEKDKKNKGQDNEKYKKSLQTGKRKRNN